MKEDIKIMMHHLPDAMIFLNGYVPKRFETWVYDKIYGKGARDRLRNFWTSLDIENTYVNIVSDTSPHNPNAANLDAICESCRYSNICSDDVTETISIMFAKTPYLIPLVLFSSRRNFKRSKEITSKIPRGRYKLKDLKEKFDVKQTHLW